MKRVLTTLVLLMVLSITAQETKRVFGKVSDGNNPIENVKISIIDKDTNTFTGNDGSYEIMVAEGDKLQFTYTGLRTILIKIEDVTRVLNPIMVPDVNELDEVVVEASSRRSQQDMEEDYAINKSIIRTAWGYLDADRAAGNIRILSDDEFNPISLCVLGVLVNRFPGVSIFGNCPQGGGVVIRGVQSINNSSAAVFDVDGQIFTDAPVWIDVNSIKRIAILNNLATTATYGSFGSGGVVVINTVGGIYKNNKIVDRARLKNNFADGKELSKAEVAENAPTYLKEFMASDSFETSKTIFEKYHSSYSNSPYFFIDAYQHFHSTLGKKDFADEIIENNFTSFNDNPVLLKALAYIYEEQGRFSKANEVYREVFIQRPNYAQSYLDMARSYRNLKKHKKAASMFARYGYLLEEGFMEFDTIGFGPIINREYNNFLNLEKSAVVKGEKAKKIIVKDEEFEDTRLVFEWNDSEAEFELQFVNPGNQYHKWKHTMADNKDNIYREKEYGYTISEYLVDGSLPGLWKINVNYLGNKSLSPTYLKATIYSNYGTALQKKEVKVFKLSLKNVNQQLFTLQASSKVVSR